MQTDTLDPYVTIKIKRPLAQAALIALRAIHAGRAQRCGSQSLALVILAIQAAVDEGSTTIE